MSEKDAFGRIAAVMREYMPDNCAKCVSEAKFYSGTVKGPSLDLYNDQGKELRHPKAEQMDTFDALDWFGEFSNKIENELEKMREEDERAGRPLRNVFRFVCYRDGGCEGDFIHDPGLEEREEAHTREVLGDEVYERLQRAQEEAARIPSRREEHPHESEEEPTVEDVLDYLYRQAVDAAPEGWERIKIEFSPGPVRPDGKKTVNLTHSYRKGADEAYEVLDVPEPFDVIQAITHMRRLMSEEGQPWESITFEITPGNIAYEWK